MPMPRPAVTGRDWFPGAAGVHLVITGGCGVDPGRVGGVAEEEVISVRRGQRIRRANTDRAGAPRRSRCLRPGPMSGSDPRRSFFDQDIEACEHLLSEIERMEEDR
jgi:hypothetical protein